MTLNVQTDELVSFQDELAEFGTIGTGQVLQAMGSGLRNSPDRSSLAARSG